VSNKYIAYVTGSDAIGYSFMKNVVELAQKGATLQEGKVPCLRFPHSAFMEFETDELMEDKPGFRYQIVCENLTREQLDDLEWEAFKKQLKRQFGIGGRNREQMTREYLKASGQEE
jgi:hypothetical protein